MPSLFLRPARKRLNSMLLAITASLACTATAQASSPGSAQPPLPRTELTAGIHVIHAEVAATPDARQAGLMFRTALADNNGMLFVFEQPSAQCFWMRNTLLPLSIAFIDDDGAIVNIEDMAPQTDDTHCSLKPVRFALEMKQGWFGERGVRPGSRIGGLR